MANQSPKANGIMGGYFHGWRKKVGIFTLALACVLAIGWVRSFVVRDRIDFIKLTGFAKKHNRLSGLATDRQSLVLLAYNVDEVVARYDATSVSYSPLNSPAEIEKFELKDESRSISVAEFSSMVASGIVNLQSMTEVAEQPTKLTNSAADEQTTHSSIAGDIVSANFADDGKGEDATDPPVSVTSSLNTNSAPLPTSMANNPQAEISIRTISTQPLVSILTATSVVPLVVIPFWSITIPLALILFWLLLSKPCKSNQKSIADPILENMA